MKDAWARCMHLMSDVSDSESELVLDAPVGKRDPGTGGLWRRFLTDTKVGASFSVFSAVFFLSCPPRTGVFQEQQLAL